MPTIDRSKPFYKSRGFWGIAIFVVASVLERTTGYAIPVTEQEETVTNIMEIVTISGQAFGTGLALYGRIAATAKLSLGK